MSKIIPIYQALIWHVFGIDDFVLIKPCFFRGGAKLVTRKFRKGIEHVKTIGMIFAATLVLAACDAPIQSKSYGNLEGMVKLS